MPRKDTITPRLHKLLRQADPLWPKYAQLHDALTRLVDDGAWPGDECLPTEIELAAMSALSLGTVQRAIGMLVHEGRLKRVRGRGTFVSESPRMLSRPFMHLLFHDDTGEGFLPIHPRQASSALIDEQGAWSQVLGQRGNNIFRVSRVVWVGDAFRTLSRFYINADQYPFFTRKSADELTHGNYKLALLRELNLPAISFEQSLQFGALPSGVARTIGLKSDALGSSLRVIARTKPGTALYYHEMFIPPSDRQLCLPELTLRARR